MENLLKSSMIKSKFNELTYLSSSQEVEGWLDSLYFLIKKRVNELNLTDYPCSFEAKSHCKKTLLQRKTHLGTLSFEVMYFSEGNETGAHSHPEFILDEIIEGALEETQLEKKGNFFVSKEKKLVRSCGDKRMIYDPNEFYPHNVRAINGPCLVFCLSLGSKKVESIQECCL